MFGKHFASTYTGSMYGAGLHVFSVWGYIIANTINGQIELNPKALASVLGADEGDIAAALEYLCAPDPNSRSQEEEGRRLVREGAFAYRVVNHRTYRGIRHEDDRRAYNRQKMAEHRAKKRSIINTSQDASVPSCAAVSRGEPQCAHTEAEAEAEAEAEISELVPMGRLSKPDPAPSALDVSFDAFWRLYPKKTGKGAALKTWKKIKPANGLCERIAATLALYCQSDQWQKDHGQFIPNPATWLNQGRWDDEPVSSSAHSNGVGNTTGHEPVDWYEECGILHKHECQLDRYKHALRLRSDALKAEVG
jgi:hypothetical protein